MGIAETTEARVAIEHRCGALVAITWYLHPTLHDRLQGPGGHNLFDDAYADVLQAPHDRNSCQLLTWVVVAALWCRHEPAELLWTGMLGRDVRRLRPHAAGLPEALDARAARLRRSARSWRCSRYRGCPSSP